ncbi:hypothetical protein [Protofrankia symbiont of Coriaria ruscifolia]|uniref:hypothetical protein n=1 Tax=Protofrankia symbiont of Coriaria ruscifolia TaxID=1306542 RepID=UPI001040EFFC|nr:hypothetical protein [Protofrankia symbiont of Coriaria ruscifolia]
MTGAPRGAPVRSPQAPVAAPPRCAPASPQTLVIVGMVVMMLILVDRVVAGTRLGRGIRAVAADADTASLMRVDVEPMIVAVCVLGGRLTVTNGR